MAELLHAVFVIDAWSFDPVVIAGLLLAAVCYTRGWLALRRTQPGRISGWRWCSWHAGLATIWFALCSGLDPLG
ncbi:MAG: hypothetical protein MK074_05905, partial [Phycisphaerales bacterium]|nr:hypothetical protein [Phycisphaerales bacterium]